MNDFQKAIKYIAIALAVFLIVAIISGIISSLSVIGLIFGTQNKTADPQNIVSQSFTDIYELDVELDTYELVIKTGDELSVKYDSKNKNAKVVGNKLVISERNKLFHRQEGYTFVLTVPEDHVFNKASLHMGAGHLGIEKLNVGELELELGASDVDISDLNAVTSVDIEGGAGDISITNSQINGLDLNMGIGKLTLDSKLIGNNNINLGVGDSDINLKGKADDYRLDITKGIGEITIDGEKYSNNMEKFSTEIGGTSFVELDCAVGNVNIDFTE